MPPVIARERRTPSCRSAGNAPSSTEPLASSTRQPLAWPLQDWTWMLSSMPAARRGQSLPASERYGPPDTVVLVGLGNPEMTLPVEHIQNYEISLSGVFRYKTPGPPRSISSRVAWSIWTPWSQDPLGWTRSRRRSRATKTPARSKHSCIPGNEEADWHSVPAPDAFTKLQFREQAS